MGRVRECDDTEIWCQCLHRVKGYRPINKIGGKTWWVCECCNRPSKLTLNQCDICDELFMGPRPMKIAFTCPDCEKKL